MKSYEAKQRGREIGIRLALGADRSVVMRIVVAGGGRIASGGIAAGRRLCARGGAPDRRIAVRRLGRGSSTYVVVAALLLAMAVAAADLPARRAARINPRALIDV